MDFKYFYAGTLSGIIQTITGHPFDTLKVLQQNNKKNLYNLRSLYKGITMPLFQTPLICGVSFFLNDSLDNYFNNHYISGFYSGFATSFIICPFEYYKINSQNQNQKIINISSIKNSYINLRYVILRESPSCCIYFGLYNECKKRNLSSFLSGGLSGISSWLLTYPLDTIKTRMQSNKTFSFKQAIIMGSLFKGLQICLVRAFLVNSTGFYTYEYFLKKN
tara:strand:+ start:715 stop:1374 length:660 start_codon:yes stop_codon:yes gene_type:complete